MDLKDIMLFLRAGQGARAALSTAAALARMHGATVRACCVVAEPALDFADGYAIGPAAVSEVLNHRDQAIAALVKTSEEAFHQALGAGTPRSWSLSSPDEDAASLAGRARLADLAILGRSGTSDRADRALAEALTLHSGAPCLIVPEPWSGAGRLDRIVLAWNGSVEAKRALADSLALLHRASLVEVVTVGDVAADRSAQHADAVVEHLALHGIKASARRMPPEADAAAALLRCCRAVEADLLVMGAYSHARAAEAVLGGVTRSLLSHAPLPVLMAR